MTIEPFAFAADIFLSLLKLLIVPLVMSSITTGVAGVGGMGDLRRLGGKTFVYYMGTSLLAILLGPHAAFIVVASVLIVQALFFADGGLLALGCNIFNLGFLPAFVGYSAYRWIAGAAPDGRRALVATTAAAVLSLQLGAIAVVLETVASGISGRLAATTAFPSSSVCASRPTTARSTPMPSGPPSAKSPAPSASRSFPSSSRASPPSATCSSPTASTRPRRRSRS